MRTTTIIKKAIVVEAMKSSGGDVSVACLNAGMGRTQFYEWKNTDAEFRSKLEEVYYHLGQYAESKLYDKALNGDANALMRLRNKAVKRQ